jgi:hypothetical protein
MGIEQYNKGRETPGRKGRIDKIFEGIGSFFERKEKPNRAGVELYNQGNNKNQGSYISPTMNLVGDIFPKARDYLDPVNKTIVNWGTKTVPESFKRWNESYSSPVGPINTGETERDYLQQGLDFAKVPLNAIGNAAQFVHEGARTFPRAFGLDVDDDMSIANPFGIHFDKKHAGIGATGYYLDWMSKGLTGMDLMPGYNENPLLDPSLSENVMADEWKNAKKGIVTTAGKDKITEEVNRLVDPDTWVKNNPQGDRSFDEWETAYKKDWDDRYSSLMDEEYGSEIDALAQKNYESRMLDKYGLIPELDEQGYFVPNQLPYGENFEFGAFDPLVDFIGNFRDRKIIDYSNEDAGFLHGLDEIMEVPISMGLPGLMRQAAKKSPKMAKALTAISPGQLGGNIGKGTFRTFVPPIAFEGLEGYYQMRQDEKARKDQGL